MRHLRPAEAAIDYAQRCHILTHSLPEIDAGATRENDHSALGRVRSVGLFESADGSFPEPRLPHRPENVAPNGTGNEKYDERCCNGSLHVETHTTGEYSICEFQKSSPDRFQMSEWTQTDWRVGMWSAMSAATIGAIFVVVGLIGVVARPPSSEPLQQGDPYLAILETLMILLAVLLVIMMAAMHAYAPPEHKTFSLAALAFVICFAVTTCGAHFASLTIGRQADPRALPLLSHQLSTGDWPTLAMSLDLLAWDLFLGLALVFAAGVLRGEATRRVRVSMTAAGTLCLAGTLGPASGHLRIQYFGIAGYAFVLPLACALLAVFFWQERGAGVRTG